jgi:hypothetical protein
MWESPEWATEWEKRIESHPPDHEEKVSARGWRRELSNRIKTFNAGEKSPVKANKPVDQKALEQLSRLYFESLIRCDPNNIVDRGEFKRFLLNDPTAKAAFSQQVSLGNIPSGVTHEGLVNDPLFDVIYEKAKEEYTACAKFQVKIDRKTIEKISNIYINLLYQCDPDTLPEPETFKKFLLNNPTAKDALAREISLGNIPSHVTNENIVNDPIFDVIYEKAKQGYV